MSRFRIGAVLLLLIASCARSWASETRGNMDVYYETEGRSSRFGTDIVRRDGSHRPKCTIVGTWGDDQPLEGTQHDDVICALAGDDWVSGMDGNDTLILGPGDDAASGGRGDDVILGGAGRDNPLGDAGNDRMLGQGDRDFMDDYHGRDVMSGGGGDDLCLNVGDGHGGDVVRGGPGRDHFWADDEDQVYSAEVRRLTCG